MRAPASETEPPVPWSLAEVPPQLDTAGEEARSRLGLWAQGDLVDGVPATWIAPGLDIVTGLQLRDPQTEGATAVFDPDATASWVIASQTCDIGASSPGSHHAFVEVVPLVPASRLPSSTASLANNGRVNYLVPVDHERREDGSAAWFADLRMLMPISKAVLLERERRSAFATPEAALSFAEHLAAKFRRPALHAALSEELGRAIDAHIKKRIRHNAFAHTEHIRVAIKDGDRIHPRVVALVVVLRERLDSADQVKWREVDAVAKSVLTPHEIKLDPTVMGTAEALSAQTYRNSVPLRVDSLGNFGVW